MSINYQIKPEKVTEYDFILGFTGGTVRGIYPNEGDREADAPAAAAAWW